MNKNILNTCIVATLFGLASVNASAATIVLDPVSPTTINLSDTVTFNILADFSAEGGTFGGSLNIFYDETILSYNNDFIINPGFNSDPFFTSTGLDCSTSPGFGCDSPGQIAGIATGNFAGGMAAVGPTLMGTLSFTGNAKGLSLLTMESSLEWGYWADNSGSTFVTQPTYIGSSVAVNAVPVPAAVWLMLSGLGLIGGLVRRK